MTENDRSFSGHNPKQAAWIILLLAHAFAPLPAATAFVIAFGERVNHSDPQFGSALGGGAGIALYALAWLVSFVSAFSMIAAWIAYFRKKYIATRKIGIWIISAGATAIGLLIVAIVAFLGFLFLSMGAEYMKTR